MLDPCEKSGSDGEEVSSKSMEGGDNQQKKTCADCGTSKTPLWRGGPAGPKSLCNACGIRSRKKKRDSLGLNRATGAGAANEKKLKKANHHNNNNNSSNHKLGDGLKQRLMALGREVMMRRSTAAAENKRRKFGEEEQAAVLLMALSYGSVYA